jgi:hypothetical protein
MEFQVVELDVWGNSEDGYDVNDVYVTDEVITITEDATDKEIGDWLREHLYPNLPAITIDGDYEFSLFVDAKEDGEPLLELKRER